MEGGARVREGGGSVRRFVGDSASRNNSGYSVCGRDGVRARRRWSRERAVRAVARRATRAGMVGERVEGERALDLGGRKHRQLRMFS